MDFAHKHWVPRREGARIPEDVVCLIESLCSGGHVAFASNYGGFVQNVGAKSFQEHFRKVTDEELTTWNYKPAVFCFDEGPMLYGYTTGRRWNGWGIPWVELAVLKEWHDLSEKQGVVDKLFRFEGEAVYHTCEGEEYELKQDRALIDGKWRTLYDAGCGLVWNQDDIPTAERLLRRQQATAIVRPADLAEARNAPLSCPFCGCKEVSRATGEEPTVDQESGIELDEYQCTGSCGRSFWI